LKTLFFQDYYWMAILLEKGWWRLRNALYSGKI
jgi:hypothetical protein